MRVRSKGQGIRYDKFSGNWLDEQKKTSVQVGVYLAFGKRFCETCQSHKPSDGTKAFKGWQCLDCKKLKIKAAKNG